jgi:3-oxoacyl-[acyl-carrier protein] reductase
MNTGLQDKIALVTGANNPYGIGAATANTLAAEGATVFIHYYRDPDLISQIAHNTPTTPGEEFYAVQSTATADTVLQTIRERGGRAEAWEADLSDPAVIPQLFEHVERAFGPVDILVNNAAGWMPDTFTPPQADSQAENVPLWPPSSTHLSPESFERNFAVNSRAVALMMAEYGRRHVARKANWGRIINVSTDGSPNFPNEISYGASKYATESYSRSAASELGKFGITVNIVSPGPIQTGWISPEWEAELNKTTPLGRIGHPADIADVVVFLASEQARWLTGQLLFVGGGHRMI